MQVSIMSAIRHPNVVLFMGVCLDPPCMVTEVRGHYYCLHSLMISWTCCRAGRAFAEQSVLGSLLSCMAVKLLSAVSPLVHSNSCVDTALLIWRLPCSVWRKQGSP